MKCHACGYRYNEPDNSSGEKKLITDGSDTFVKVINTFHRKTEDGSLDEVYLFACPRCGTVRMEKWR